MIGGDRGENFEDIGCFCQHPFRRLLGSELSYLFTQLFDERLAIRALPSTFSPAEAGQRRG